MGITTVPAAMLEEIQGWAPGGGHVHSTWRTGEQLQRGDLIRRGGIWVVITDAGEAVTENAAGKVTDRSPSIAWVDHYGRAGGDILWAAAAAGAEVRTDTRIDPETLPVPAGV
jgi:hypothetical protein